MADSLKTRVGRVIAGSLHALVDKIEDQTPEAVMEQAIRESETLTDEVRHELGVVSANRHLAQRQHSSLNEQHSKIASQIDQALSEGREDLVRAGVSRQLDIEVQLPVLETTLGELNARVTELEGYVTALLAKRREMEDALAEFRNSRTAGSRVASGASMLTTATLDARMDRVTDAFDRVFVRQTGVADPTTKGSLMQAAQLRELEDLSRENKIAERLASLKASKAGKP